MARRIPLYEAPANGPATASEISTDPSPRPPNLLLPRAENIRLFEIDEATLMPPNKIKLIARYTKFSRTDGGTAPQPSEPSPEQIIIEKNGPQIRFVDARYVDGSRFFVEAGISRSSGQPVRPLNKCDDSSVRDAPPPPMPENIDLPRPDPQPNYLLSLLRPNEALAHYLKLLDGRFQLADADGNGELSDADGKLLNEMAAANLRTMYLTDFYRADLNADGVVTTEELRQLQTYRFRSGGAQPAPGKTIEQTVEDQIQEIMAADANHDGRVTFAEALYYARLIPPIFGNSELSNLMSVVPGGKAAVTRADFDAAVEKFFRDVDTNGDGVVSAEELSAYRQAHPQNTVK